MPISSCTLIDEHRQWFKSILGFAAQEIPRELSFCNATIQQSDLLIVEDLTRDERFAAHPMVTGGPEVRFYAGMPLPDSEGHMVGTLCIADTVPRQLSETQKSTLRILASQLQARIELAAERRKRQAALHEKEQLVHALHSNEHRFRTFMNSGPFVAYIRDREGRFLFYNDNLATRFRVSRDAWIGTSLRELFPAEVAERYMESDARAFSAPVPTISIEESDDETGHSYWRSCKFPFPDEHGNLVLGGISVDVTEEYNASSALEQSNARLEQLAHVDSLTGLANRHAGDRALQAAALQSQKALTSLSVVMLDLDNFKHRNDTHGHASGDNVLRQLGILVRRVLRSSDVAIRYGGEEFLLVLSNTDAAAALRTAQRIRNALHEATWEDGPVTASFGIATASSAEIATLDPRTLIELADHAMYEAKTSGKDRIVTSHAATHAFTEPSLLLPTPSASFTMNENHA